MVGNYFHVIKRECSIHKQPEVLELQTNMKAKTLLSAPRSAAVGWQRFDLLDGDGFIFICESD